MKEVDIANGVITYDESYITPLSQKDLAKLAEDKKQKEAQSHESVSDDLLKRISFSKNALNLNKLLLNIMKKLNEL